jgi:hypothetical protein
MTLVSFPAFPLPSKVIQGARGQCPLTRADHGYQDWRSALGARLSEPDLMFELLGGLDFGHCGVETNPYEGCWVRSNLA